MNYKKVDAFTPAHVKESGWYELSSPIEVLTGEFTLYGMHRIKWRMPTCDSLEIAKSPHFRGRHRVGV